ncbi:MAG: TetR/AcrR family transcriptional regulator [Ktedonobacterales bacterium]
MASERPSAERDMARSVRRRPGRPALHAPIGAVETQSLILRQARQLFMQRGFADVSVGEVAEAVGVTKPTLYYHFQSKEGLYSAVLCELMREIGSYLRAIIGRDLSTRDRLREIAEGYFLHANTTMELMLRDTQELIGPERAAEVFAAYQREMFDPMLDLMRDGAQRGELRAGVDPNLLARAFLGLLDTFNEPGRRDTHPPEQHRSVAAQLVALFLDGATAHEAHE